VLLEWAVRRFRYTRLAFGEGEELRRFEEHFGALLEMHAMMRRLKSHRGGGAGGNGVVGVGSGGSVEGEAGSGGEGMTEAVDDLQAWQSRYMGVEAVPEAAVPEAAFEAQASPTTAPTMAPIARIRHTEHPMALLAAVQTQQGVVYGRAGGSGRELTCRIHSLAQSPTATAIVALHGGSGRGRGSRKSERLFSTLSHYATRGYVCVAPEYRLASEASRPAQIHDVRACLRWVRANAERLGVHADRIGVAGFASGASLALLVSQSRIDDEDEEEEDERSEVRPSFCLAYYPALDRPAGMPAGECRHQEHEQQEQQQRQQEGLQGRQPPPPPSPPLSIDPYRFVSSSSAPTIFFHGTADAHAPVGVSTALFDALQGVGVAAELHSLDGAAHGFDAQVPELAEACAMLGSLFIDRHVVKPARRYPPFNPRLGEALWSPADSVASERM
jgi:acetyl esterase/lipase